MMGNATRKPTVTAITLLVANAYRMSITATVGADLKNVTMGDMILCTGFASPPSAARASAATKDITKHISVRARLMPTAVQNPDSLHSEKKLSITTSGIGKTSGLSLTFATIAHIASTRANETSG